MSTSRPLPRLPVLGFLLCGALASPAEEVSPECRGVAAGIVAAMRAADEISAEREVDVAVVAARRACSAARQDLGPTDTAATTATDAPAVDAAKKEPSVWDLLTRDRELKPGNERLRRLKTQ